MNAPINSGRSPRGGLEILDRWLGRLTAAASVLVIPISFLLCAQWPLRDWLQAGSREANDLAQLLFGLYVSIGITYATRCGSHLTPDAFAQRYTLRVRRLLIRAAALCIVIPWASFILYAATPAMWQSIRQFEGFPDTFNPGYFILKISVWLLALLALLQALIDVAHPGAHPPQPGVH